tara:strand:+ start:1664 stop:2749 length:1086 start_codon:yes stop_codon:yes gene_type:complete
MNIAFYIDEMNYRGVANSTYQFALQNQKILKNKSIIFYNKKNYRNQKEVINKFKNKFKVFGISHFSELENYKNKILIDYLYVQKSGNKDIWTSNKIKTLIHSVYPQKLSQIHGDKYVYISEWLSKNFSNNKVPFVPLITKVEKNKNDLKKKLRINKDKLVFGCYGGESSFDLQFVKNAIMDIVENRQDILFIFLNIKKFSNHKQIKFLKGTLNENYKKKFINSCDAMIYGRSLGESFGLSCGEFTLVNKRIISYKFNRHRAHIFNISSDHLIEYESYNSFKKIILNFKKKSLKIDNKYKDYSENKVMVLFQNIFLKKEQNIKLSFWDYLKNFQGFIKIGYFYLRHKIYVHYFNFFENKFLR